MFYIILGLLLFPWLSTTIQVIAGGEEAINRGIIGYLPTVPTSLLLVTVVLFMGQTCETAKNPTRGEVEIAQSGESTPFLVHRILI